MWLPRSPGAPTTDPCDSEGGPQSLPHGKGDVAIDDVVENAPPKIHLLKANSRMSLLRSGAKHGWSCGARPRLGFCHIEVDKQLQHGEVKHRQNKKYRSSARTS